MNSGKKTSRISVFLWGKLVEFDCSAKSWYIWQWSSKSKNAPFWKKKTKKTTYKFGNLKQDSKKIGEIPVLVAIKVRVLIYNQTSTMLLDYLKTFEFRKPTLSEYKTSSGYRNESWKDLEKEKCLKNNPFFSLKS